MRRARTFKFTERKLLTLGAGFLILGLFLGAFLFSPIQRRSFLSFNSCEDRCLNANELTGLAASLGIQFAPNILPLVVKETDKFIAFIHPFPEAPFHFVVVPKKDIKSVSDISSEDMIYLTDAFALMQFLIQEYNLTRYTITTNGPGYQKVGYLHFHLTGEK